MMAEREGFEPSIEIALYTPLAGERLQPLGHFSVNKDMICITLNLRFFQCYFAKKYS